MSEPINLTHSQAGIRLSVHVTPGAKRTSVGGQQGSALRVTVAAAPEKGRANKAVVEAVCKALGLRKADCSVIAGWTSRSKTLLLQSDDFESLRTKVDQLVSTKQ